MKKLFNNLKINRIIWYLTFSDIFSWGLFFVINTIAGIYLSDKLGEKTVEIVGIGFAIYMIVRGILQIPLGSVTDRFKDQGDEIAFLFLGNLLMGFPFVLFPFINNAGFYYVLQLIFGIGSSLNLVSWRKLFALNMDKNREGLAYGIYDAFISISTAIFSVIAGFLASHGQEMFDLLIFVFGLFIMFSTIWPTLIYFHKKRPKLPSI